VPLAPLPRGLRAPAVRGRALARVPGSEPHVRGRHRPGRGGRAGARALAGLSPRALCAAEIRARRPDLTIVLFWHIPWPNAEVFRIVPWKREILEGLSPAISSASTFATTG
jgi:hypothetical protein